MGFSRIWWTGGGSPSRPLPPPQVRLCSRNRCMPYTKTWLQRSQWRICRTDLNDYYDLGFNFQNTVQPSIDVLHIKLFPRTCGSPLGPRAAGSSSSSSGAAWPRGRQCRRSQWSKNSWRNIDFRHIAVVNWHYLLGFACTNLARPEAPQALPALKLLLDRYRGISRV